ncbi:Flavin-dependent oxidoreductase, luciferase family (includes alkanesulfonate monooxygenase SsuD and methylene tetrahydromethanopterin reductase) [Lentzea xinjiangensis]|uniref:Flavin-dependent oxidoreductase, luciferase family (Includes alkanesulfonate monooxygenase SsuD and methylene tetrahydromethanopterin reductase) n=1 Tax=Lentzea xinjiangensis TaxID=402600 RepID=A0A1H9MJD6_9PSEU|nr:LLM class flavin-dependent oxidoreductase [Lentzea xinjiangensis]SER23263.1 Flavin-dependent oxidoreductase, luciferase family (includes alkanesulfonate monooxygenase SsuD and methylene tetrahydromethanopterin reductase) [Lentzea xinjiangensis]
MTDYGHPLEFGVFLPPAAEQFGETLRLAQAADVLGLEFVSLQDHPYNATHLDTWTSLSVIGASTSNVRVFPNVANLPLRPPAVLARAAASLDVITGGRVELGLGAGAFWDAIAAMGGPRRTAGESVQALEEAIAVIRALWTPGRGVRLQGAHYSLDGARPGPFPAHDIGIWLGAYKKRMLQLTGRAADGWLPSSPYAPPEQLRSMNTIIDEAAEEAGRSPKDVKRLYNITPGFTAEQLARLALDEGVSGFILMVNTDDELRVFAEEIAPAVRELVAKERTAVPEALGVTPTPDDGTRLSATRLWDEAQRPKGPAPDSDAVYTASGRALSRQLIGVHNHLREELAKVREMVRQVADGVIDVGQARSAINTMTMRQNNWTMGAYCESYCRLVTIHHTLEDRSLYPQLRDGDARLGPVLDRLTEEHHVIHDVLERLDAALVATVAEPKRIGEVQDAVDLLTDTLLSHLSYEEHELVEPMARIPYHH